MIFTEPELYQTKMRHGRSGSEKIRADAKAEGLTVAVGGWILPKSEVTKEARWYGLSLTKSNAPWAFAAGEPFRTIASLELYATLLCITLFDLGGVEDYALELAGETDNAGNSFVTARMMTTKWPLAAILMEIAIQLRKRQISMSLDWIPRLQNEEADAITNEDFKSFAAEHRITTSVEEAAEAFVLLPRLLKAGEEVQGIVDETAKKPGLGSAGKKKTVLKPWDPKMVMTDLMGARLVARRDVEPTRQNTKKRKKRPLGQRLRATQPW